MEHLPFTVVYGEHLWFLFAAVFSLISLMWIWGRPWLTIRFGAARQRKRLGEPSALETAVQGEPITLSGVLGLEGEATKGFDDGEPAAATTAAPVKPADVLGALSINRSGKGITLDVGGVTMSVEGELEVLVGSRELFSGTRFRGLRGRRHQELYSTNGDALSALSRLKAAFRSLAAGDSVRLRGYLRRLATEGAGEGYRTPGDRWVLSAQPDVGSEETSEWTIAGVFEGLPKVGFPGAVRLLSSSLLTSLMWLGAVGLLGFFCEFWMLGPFIGSTTRASSVTQEECRDQAITPATHLWFTLPSGNKRKLAQLVDEGLENQCQWDHERVKQLAAAYQLQGRCGRSALAFIEHGALRLGEERALACVDDERFTDVFAALQRVGRFTEASQRAHSVHTPWRLHNASVASVHLIADEREGAAFAALNELRYQFGPRHESVMRQPPTTRYERRAASISCLADALAVERGEEALDRLRINADIGRDTTDCPILHAEVLTGEQRRQTLIDLVMENPREVRDHRWSALVMLASDGEERLEELSTWFVGFSLGRMPRDLLQPPRVEDFTGLELRALGALEGRDALSTRATVLRAELNARATVFELAMGEDFEARRHARRVVEDLSSLEPLADIGSQRFKWYQRGLARLATVQLLAGDAASKATIARLRGIEREFRGPNVEQMPLLQTVAVQEFVERGESALLYSSGVVPSGRYRDMWEVAARGNGVSFARELSGRRPTIDAFFHPLPPTASFVEQGALNEQARWGFRGTYGGYSRGNERLFRQLMIHAWDRRMARALGDDEWAAEVEPVYARFREAFLRRDIATFLKVLERY